MPSCQHSVLLLRLFFHPCQVRWLSPSFAFPLHFRRPSISPLPYFLYISLYVLKTFFFFKSLFFKKKKKKEVCGGNPRNFLPWCVCVLKKHTHRYIYLLGPSSLCIYIPMDKEERGRQRERKSIYFNRAKAYRGRREE